MGSTSGRGVHHRKKTYFGWPKELTSVFWETGRRTLSSVGSTWLTKDKAYPFGRVRPCVCVHTHPDLTETARPPAGVPPELIAHSDVDQSSSARCPTRRPHPCLPARPCGAPPDDPTLICLPAHAAPHQSSPPIRISTPSEHSF
jgi:hypothetical protein